MREMGVRGRRIALLLAAALWAAPAGAADLRWHGFMTAGGAVTDTETGAYAGRIDDGGDYGDTVFGLSVSKALDPSLRVSAQMSSAVSGEIHNHRPDNRTDGQNPVQGTRRVEYVSLDWAVMHYEPTDNLTLRVGKVPFLARLISEYKKVGYTYPWIRPPQVLYGDVYYSVALGLDAFRGASVAYGGSLGGWDYKATVYGGNASKAGFDHDRMQAVRLDLENDVLHLYAGYNHSYTVSDMEPFAGLVDGKWMDIWTAGGKLDWNGVVAYAEAMRNTPQGSAPPNALSQNPIEDLETDAWYATLGYRLFGNILPHVTYSQMDMAGYGWGQEAWTAGVRWDIKPGVALKAEYQLVDPQDLDLPVDRDRDGTPEDTYSYSGLFTPAIDSDQARIYSLAVNFLF